MIIEPQILHQLLNVRKGDVPMALLPDPTTAASERSSVKNRLTGSRRRGSGRKNRHRSRTVSKTSLRGARRMRAQRVQGQGCPQHESTQPGPLTLLPHKMRVRHKNRHRSQLQKVRKDDLPMALLPDPTTAASERSPVKIYMSLPQCIEGCPQHETRVRHKQRHRSRTVSKTSLRGEAG